MSAGSRYRAVILAAGMGSRLKKYTAEVPKGMLEFEGKSLIGRQVETLKRCGIEDITVITGYMADKIRLPGVQFFHNAGYAETNMVESLMCAKDFLKGNVIVGYGDVIYDGSVLNGLLTDEHDYAVVVDEDWQDYWGARYDKVETDLESLETDGDGYIVSLGRSGDIDIAGISARYVGLLKFSPKGIETVKTVYEECRAEYWGRPWQQSGREFRQAYMTDLIQELIDRQYPVYGKVIRRGWLEFDTDEDYERMTKLAETGGLSEFIKLED